MKRLLALAALLLLFAAGCGDSDDDADDAATTDAPAATSDAPGGGEAVITISGFAFSELTVAPGTTVTVENLDEAAHTVTSSGAEFSGVSVDPQSSGTFTAPDAPGEYAYICSIHPSMSGTLVVS